jgi:hypothetical protein
MFKPFSVQHLPPPMYTLTGFDLATLKLQTPRWQAETEPLDFLLHQGNIVLYTGADQINGDFET